MGNSMIVKTALATLLTASLAGGVVYYGTQSPVSTGNEVSLEPHPHKTVKVTESNTGAEKTDSEETAISEPAERVIDKMLKRDAGETATTTETTEIETTTTIVDETQDVAISDDVNDYEQAEPDETESDPISPFEVSDAIETIDKAYESAALAEIDKHNLIKTVYEQADTIQTPELRDQAYLDVVTYAIRHKLYGAANKAITKIDQVPFRDTARARIAISLAKGGNIQDAFTLIDKVETEELRDIMRLQVIEAMIVPERLPSELVQD